LIAGDTPDEIIADTAGITGDYFVMGKSPGITIKPV
jgi:hypothetical protein